jgi:hypothetical protein
MNGQHHAQLTPGVFMDSARTLFVVAVGVAFVGQPASAQDLSRYRAYVLESNLETVITASAARLADAKTLHERPAKIQELEWRAPYVISGSELADPVQDVTFTFYNDALYRVVVKYDRDRTEGLTNSDLIASLSATYGAPVPASAQPRTARAAEVLADTTVVARWDSPSASLTLLRGASSPELQLILASKSLSARATTAIREAGRLDTIEAPRRELEQRKKDVADATAVRDKARAVNKAAFRP